MDESFLEYFFIESFFITSIYYHKDKDRNV